MSSDVALETIEHDVNDNEVSEQETALAASFSYICIHVHCSST